MKIVYFIREGYFGRIKIGITDWKHRNRRLRQLQTGSPDKLYPLGYIIGGRKKEKWLHRKFKHAHVRGEWFRPTLDLLWFILWRAREWDIEPLPLWKRWWRSLTG